MIYLLPLLGVIMLSLPLITVYKRITTGEKAKGAIIFNLVSFAGMIVLALAFPISGYVSAATETAAAVNPSAGLGYIAAAISTGLAALGAGIAVASAAPAAIGAISEDPKAIGKTMIFVALGEGVALFGVLISIMILGRI